MLKTILSLALFTTAAYAQNGTTGLPAPQLMGSGTPVGNAAITCSSTNLAGALYIDIQTSPSGSRLWTCDNAPGTFGWHQLATSVLATTASIGGAALLAGTCTTALTVSVPGAVVGKNVQLTPSDGSLQQGGTVAQGSVSPAGTVNYQLCATGLVSVTPTAKTYTIQVLP